MNSISEGINTHTPTQVDAATVQQLNHHAFIWKHLQLLTSAFRKYSTHMTSFFLALNSKPTKRSFHPNGLLITKDAHE
jgi:hypothetical protein